MTAIKQQKVSRPGDESWRDAIPGVHFATAREAERLFDHQAREALGISGIEFLARWDRGDYRQSADSDDARKVRRMELLIPIVRQTKA